MSNEIRAALNTGQNRAWRNNIAKIKVRGRWINYGIPGAGGSDLIGLHSMTIEPHHVGKKFAVFMAIEVKSPTGKPSPEQVSFINFINNQGGIAGIARSAEEALTIISDFK